jgi:hypothetical protein
LKVENDGKHARYDSEHAVIGSSGIEELARHQRGQHDPDIHLERYFQLEFPRNDHERNDNIQDWGHDTYQRRTYDAIDVVSGDGMWVLVERLEHTELEKHHVVHIFEVLIQLFKDPKHIPFILG